MEQLIKVTLVVQEMHLGVLLLEEAEVLVLLVLMLFLQQYLVRVEME